MKKTVTKYEFIKEMSSGTMGFSFNGAQALYEFFDEIEAEIDDEIQFDPVAFSCDYTEYENLKECLDQYSDIGVKSLDDLKEHTSVIEVTGTDKIVIENF